MPSFTLVYYELNRIERTVEAETMEAAIAEGERLRHEVGGWEGCTETTHGTNGVEMVINADGETLYDAGTVAGMVEASDEETV